MEVGTGGVNWVQSYRASESPQDWRLGTRVAGGLAPKTGGTINVDRSVNDLSAEVVGLLEPTEV